MENNNVIEVLREMIERRNYILKPTMQNIVTQRDKDEFNVLKEACLALERLDEIKIDLKLIKQNIEEDNYVNLKQQVIDDLNEVINYD